jgi:enoyl-CoA hydratase/carnithine racemase
MNIRIVSSKAKIGFVFARRGIVMEAISSYFLPRLIGYGRAMHLITTGAVYPSTSPLFQELFSEIAEPGDVLPRALELADDISRNTSSVSTHLMKDMIWRGPDNAEESHLLDSRILVELFRLVTTGRVRRELPGSCRLLSYRGRDKLEGVESFLEKRDPNFTGRMSKDAPSAWPWWRPIETTVPGVKGPKPKI